MVAGGQQTLERLQVTLDMEQLRAELRANGRRFVLQLVGILVAALAVGTCVVVFMAHLVGRL